MKKTIFLTVLALSLVIAANGFAAAKTVIVYKPNVIVEGLDVHLGDVAEINGENCEVLKGLKIQKAPMPGKKTLVKADYVLMKLRQAGFDTEIIDFSGASIVEVGTPGTTVASKELERLTLECLRERLGEVADRCEITMIRPPAPVFLPEGEYEWEIRPMSETLLGSVPVQLVAKERNSGTVVETIRTCPRIERVEAVLIAAREVARGELLSETDFQYQDYQIKSKYQLRDLITDPEQLVGMESRRFIALGEPFKKSMLQRQKLIEYGDSVRIEYRQGPLYICAQGVARQNGYLGDQIRVKSLAGDKEVMGEVTGEGIVRMH